jgi:uncharacterized protein YjbJ (UPF0337 family)
MYGRAKDAAREAADTVRDAVGERGGRPDADRPSAEGRFREAQGAGQDLYGQAKGAARDAAGYMRDAYDHADDYARDGGRVIRHQVEKSPLAALLIAGLAGYALALLIHGRR